MFVYSLLLILLAVRPAHAAEAPFHHDIFCQQKNVGDEEGQSLRIVYDRSQHRDLGLIGEIRVELNTGAGDLANIAAAIGADRPYDRILRTEGIAGQVGNLLVQDDGDPMLVSLIVGFSKMDLLGPDQEIQKSLANFLTTVTLSRVHERGFFEAARTKVVSRERILLEISGGLGGFGHYSVRFDPSDCTTLN